MTHGLSISKDQMDEFCRRWKVAELSVNQSQARKADSDVGFYVRFDPTADWSLLDRMEMQKELQQLSGRSVSLQSRHGETVRRGKGKQNGVRLLYDA